MNQPSINPPSATTLPPDAEQIEYLPYELIYYVLPGTTDRPCPIHVIVGNDMRRVSVDQWYERIVEIYTKSTDPAVYILHDLRNPQVHFSAYSMSRVRSLITLRPELGGGAAIILSTKDQVFLSALRNSLQDPRLPRTTRIFADYESAVQWLDSLMQK